MAKKITAIVIVISIALLITLLLTPASWLTRQLQTNIPSLFIENSSGYLWRGQASHVEWISRGYSIPLDNVHWRFQWSSLLSLKSCMAFTFSVQQHDSQGTACFPVLTDKVYLHDLNIQLPAVIIAELLGITIQGHIESSVNYLVLQKKRLADVQGDIIWRQAEFSNGQQWLDLGTILVSLSHDNQSDLALHWLDMANTEGLSPVDIDVEMIFSDQKLQSITGLLKPLHTTDIAIFDTLNLISQYREGNHFYIDQRF